MKLVAVKCENCGATLMVPEGSTRVQCEYCDSVFALDDGASHIKFDDAGKAGYDFERGRIRAQKEEAARRHAASYGSSSYESDTREFRNSEERTSYSYQTEAPHPKNHWDPSQGAPTSDQKIWAIVRLIVTFFFGVLGAHKFMDGKIAMGLLYLFTGGLIGIGWFVDLIVEVIELLRMYSI